MPQGKPFPQHVWDAIEPRYRAGLEPLKDLAAEFGMNGFTITVHARVKGWGPRTDPTNGQPKPPRTSSAPGRRKFGQMIPGHRICGRCKYSTKTNPCNVCGEPAEK